MDRTIVQATDTLTTLDGTVPTSTSASIASTQAIEKLCEILLPTLHQGTMNPLATDTPSPRVLHPRLPTTPESRVPPPGPSPRVTHTNAQNIALPPTRRSTWMPTTSHDPTAPSNIHILQPIHQQHTQNSNPFAILEVYTPDDDNNSIADDITIQARNQTNGATLSPSFQRVSKPTRRINTQTNVTNPHTHTCTIHNLRPTTTPTLLPQPRVLQSSLLQTNANPTGIKSQQALQSKMLPTMPTPPTDQQPYPHCSPTKDDQRNNAI